MVRPTPFEIHRALDSGTGRLTLRGELDLATVSQLQDEVGSMLAHPVDVLVIDLSQLTFIDSSGLNSLILLNAQATDAGWTLRLVRPPESQLRIFQITATEEKLPFIDDSEAR